MSELDKLEKYDAELTVLTAFAEWLDNSDYHLAAEDHPDHPMSAKLIFYEWLGIDAAKVEQERRQLLKEVKS